MKNILFYFSGTGNCLKITKDIAKELSDCDVVNIAKTDNYDIGQYEKIGFIYPTYFVGVPKIVKDFIEKADLKKSKNAYVFVITTYGGTLGNGLSLAKELLLEKEIEVNYSCDLRMAGNYIVLYGKKDNAERLNDEASVKLKSIINDIKNNTTNSVGKSNFIFRKYYNMTINNLAQKDKFFNINKDCIGCGICKQVCPVNNIEIKEYTPSFKHHCQQCMACIQYCPKQAINYKSKTKNRKRYHHPEISYQELIKE